MLTTDQVQHIANLARIQIDAQELPKYATELSHILDFFKDLQEVDTQDVLPTAQVTGLQSVTREDIIEMSEIETDLLNCTPHTVEDNMVRLPRIM